MKRTLIQFDGSNFYKKVKKISPQTHLTPYNYRGLATYLVQGKPDRIVYCVGEVKKYLGNKKSEMLYANQQSLFSNLRKQEVQIKLGYLLFSDGAYHEKGVDVQIAADVIYGAVKDEYDICYLISSDTDLLPAIHIARNEGKEVIYIGFEHFISRALLKNCSSYRILKKDEILQFA